VGQGERAEGAAVSSAADQQAEATRSPEEIRADIDTTREQVGDTVEALAEKTDVKAQMQQHVETAKENVRAKAGEARTKLQASTPATAQEGGRQAVAKVRENPAPVVLGGAVLVAFLLGRRSARS
jgi:hypothetical protein